MGDFYDNSFSPGGYNPGTSGSAKSTTRYEEPPQVSRPTSNRSYDRSYDNLHVPEGFKHQGSGAQPASSSARTSKPPPLPKSTQHSNSKDSWNPSSDGRWSRVQGEVYAGEGARDGGPAIRQVPVTSTSGNPVYKTNYGNRVVYGYRGSDGVASFSDRKPQLQAEPTTRLTQWGDK